MPRSRAIFVATRRKQAGRRVVGVGEVQRGVRRGTGQNRYRAERQPKTGCSNPRSDICAAPVDALGPQPHSA
ncbi:hypothetical protein [Sphingopyxis fribergensis]